MPRKPRITAVPVEQEQKEEGLMVAGDVPDEKTDAEQMTEIIQEVKEEPKEAVSDAIVVVKPKAKRASRAKPKEEPIEEEPKEEPKEEANIDDKVACPDCDKQMSAKTLKYSHGPNCGVKKPSKKAVLLRGVADQREDDREAITEEMIERHVRTRARTERATRREAMMNNLVQAAF